ncbi:signal transducer and activator of transcription 5A-like [Tropilaelaps mercedesae]|uniref:Signal transducer and activator of transcription n=1 Tax=Tropilaelaps mercedesae TaxID=418985 RepID=A0A1V9XA39_9ACAR|nr:signal transducer and activator of transcription 5A-like [Tropilaelaps mercedesae]
MVVQGGNMSSWDRIQRLPEAQQQQLQQLYAPYIPIEVRQALSDWIDRHDWQTLDHDNSTEVNQYMITLGEQFIREVENKVSRTSEFVTRIKLIESLSVFKQHYSVDPLYYMRALRNCILTEQKMIAQYEASSGREGLQHGVSGTDPMVSIRRELDECHHNVQRLDDELKVVQQKEEGFVIQYPELQKRSFVLQQRQATSQLSNDLHCAQQQVAQIEMVIKDSVSELQQAWLNFIERIKESVQQLTSLEHQIVDTELGNWQRGQQLAGNGQPIDNNLDKIQECCEVLAELIWRHLQHVHRLEGLINTMESIMPISSGPALKDNLAQLKSRIKALLSNLVCGTFVIEKQPPQVMKTNTRFQATVRLLVGAKLSVHMSSPQVKVSIISEAQAVVTPQNGSDSYPAHEISGEILNNIGAMEYHQATKQLSVFFRNMSLKKIKRAEKKGSESVMDEKFCLLFQSMVKVADMTFSVQARSLPVVVIVHGNQEPHAWATITWDNAFSERRRLPFAVPDCVPWGQMAHVLSTKFKWATGRALSESNLHFLATKAFRSPNLGPDIHDLMLNWGQFCKDQLPNRGFTFWEWFYAIMKVTREHLRGLWTDGLLWGFISRRETEDLLLQKQDGTFLLRFSDSELGGVSVAWVSGRQQGCKEILMVQPSTAKDFQIRSLADRISDIKHIFNLYPDVPKNQAFGKHYSNPREQENRSGSGYIRPEIFTHIPLLQQHSSVDSNSPALAESFYGTPASPSMYGVGPRDATYGDPASMPVCSASSVQTSGQPLKRLREASMCGPPTSHFQHQASSM